jgi:hypothetical protein
VDKTLFIIGSATLGAPATAVIYGASLLGDILGAQLPGDLSWAGLLAAEGSYFVLGSSGFIPVFIAGALVSAALFERRRLYYDELKAAQSIFADTIPYDQIWITNLAMYYNGAFDRQFATDSIGGGYMLGAGSMFDNCLENDETRRTFIHELTHVWQMECHSKVSTYCNGARNRIVEWVDGLSAVYNVNTINAPWESYNWKRKPRSLQHWILFETFFRSGVRRTSLSNHILRGNTFVNISS